ncbi:MAG: ADP/ATP-dependent (S)-NAD(P)H-hydrate dehydratase, partial [Thermoplasmata archaeon]
PNLVVRPVGRERFAPEDGASLRAVVAELHPKAIVLGMGAGRDPGTIGALAEAIASAPSETPIVVDADALDALPPAAPPGRRIVATPNAGEYARVFGGRSDGPLSEVVGGARAIAALRRVVLVVKGDPDLITDGEESFQNHHHSMHQTVSGVGDILAGTLGSLVGLGLRPIHAARLATYWVGEAGIRAAARRGIGTMATDLLDELAGAAVDALAPSPATGAPRDQT